MFKVVTLKERIRVSPENMGKKIKDAIKEEAAQKLEESFDERIGNIICVIDVKEVGEGIIMPGDGGIFYDAKLSVLVYKPELHELVNGEVIDNAEFGAFIRIGALDGLVHISQIMDDYVSYDSKNSVFIGRESKKSLKEGDLVRARIISISYEKELKIGLTMRQPNLGSLAWIEQEKRKKK